MGARREACITAAGEWGPGGLNGPNVSRDRGGSGGASPNPGCFPENSGGPSESKEC